MVAVDGLTGFKSAAGEELLGRLWTPWRWQETRPISSAAASSERTQGVEAVRARRYTPGSAHPADRRRPAHRHPGQASRGPVRRQAPRRRSGHLGPLPAPHPGLPG
ncbi:hypothetical protein HMPREF9056_02440 [Actinomyces sp. oral taxon 170 str. F0386]|nr:hypothetical protein HMPREF9056_02440 [Actinomyces sp. oral taxon 170 str. F0386]